MNGDWYPTRKQLSAWLAGGCIGCCAEDRREHEDLNGIERSFAHNACWDEIVNQDRSGLQHAIVRRIEGLDLEKWGFVRMRGEYVG